jgi:hypothetical protein
MTCWQSPDSCNADRTESNRGGGKIFPPLYPGTSLFVAGTDFNCTGSEAPQALI